VPMVQLAKRLSPLARQHVMSGKVTVGYYIKLAVPKPVIKTPNPVLKLTFDPPDPAELAARDDEALREIIKRRGVNRVLDIAAAVEAAQSQRRRHYEKRCRFANVRRRFHQSKADEQENFQRSYSRARRACFGAVE